MKTKQDLQNMLELIYIKLNLTDLSTYDLTDIEKCNIEDMFAKAEMEIKLIVVHIGCIK